jgi:hypothetical protein
MFDDYNGEDVGGHQAWLDFMAKEQYCNRQDKPAFVPRERRPAKNKTCPACKGRNISTNGHSLKGRVRFRCRDCNKTFY